MEGEARVQEGGDRNIAVADSAVVAADGAAVAGEGSAPWLRRDVSCGPSFDLVCLFEVENGCFIYCGRMARHNHR